MTELGHVAVLGTGVIGASWAALFLAAGKRVTAHDPADGAARKLNSFVKKAWPDLHELGLARSKTPRTVEFCASAAETVVGADFIQESVPEVLGIKHRLYREIEPNLGPGTAVASSASGLMLSELQAGWRDPSRLVVGHPFNPPHLIPLVEVLGNERTAEGVIEAAESLYASAGKTTIRLRREVPGHVANRLQAAIWREAIHLAREGVASVEDIDKAISAGPGLRWALLGPTMLFHLAAGEGGIGEFCNRYGPSFTRWWKDLGSPEFDEETRRVVEDGLKDLQDTKSVEILSRERDRKLLAILKLVSGTGPQQP